VLPHLAFPTANIPTERLAIAPTCHFPRSSHEWLLLHRRTRRLALSPRLTRRRPRYGTAGSLGGRVNVVTLIEWDLDCYYCYLSSALIFEVVFGLSKHLRLIQFYNLTSSLYLFSLFDPLRFDMAPSATTSTIIGPKRPIIIGNVAGAMEDCPYAMLEPN